MTENGVDVSARSRLPALGPHGEGWVAAQLALYAAVAAAGWMGPPWPSHLRARLRIAAALAASASSVMMMGGSAALGGALTANPLPRAGADLRQGGLFGVVRHPIYGGALLGAFAWSLWFSPAALAPTAATGLFLELKSRREEAWLAERHGGDYDAYRGRVRRRFLPGLW